MLKIGLDHATIVVGERTDCWTGERRNVAVVLWIDTGAFGTPARPVLRVKNGVTGGEAWALEDLCIGAVMTAGICVCAGTFTGPSGRWDALHISGEEMTGAFAALGVEGQPLKMWTNGMYAVIAVDREDAIACCVEEGIMLVEWEWREIPLDEEVGVPIDGAMRRRPAREWIAVKRRGLFASNEAGEDP